jgi:hypothetical protein
MIGSDGRRGFVHAETMALGRFLAPAGDNLVAWSRWYGCECGFRCRGPREVWDHAQECGAKEQEERKEQER